MKNLINQIKESTVFIGFIENQKDRIIGTGFLIQVEGFFHLVTAKHVVEKNYENLYVFHNSKQFGNPIGKPLLSIYKDGLRWIRHKNQKVDIAILPFQLNANDKVSFIPDSLILEDLSEIHELIDVFYLSYQPGLHSFEQDGCVNPTIRKGVISRMNNDGTFFIDGFAFPGNSGSPVFKFPNPIHYNQGGFSIGGPLDIKLIGVMGAYIPYEDVAISQQTGRPKVIFEENTGLSLIHSTKELIEIIKDDEFIEQLNFLKQRGQAIPSLPTPTQDTTPSTESIENENKEEEIKENK